jgi:solute carrier family 25 carnitine/acylcarnitine transporter 20/29
VLDGRAKLSPAASLVAGGAAGAASWAVCFPIDVVKTRFQSDLTYRTYRCTIRAVLRSSGIGGLFAGYWTIVLGGVPRDAACLTGTEAAQRALTLRRQSISLSLDPTYDAS